MVRVRVGVRGGVRVRDGVRVRVRIGISARVRVRVIISIGVRATVTVRVTARVRVKATGRARKLQLVDQYEAARSTREGAMRRRESQRSWASEQGVRLPPRGGGQQVPEGLRKQECIDTFCAQ